MKTLLFVTTGYLILSMSVVYGEVDTVPGTFVSTTRKQGKYFSRFRQNDGAVSDSNDQNENQGSGETEAKPTCSKKFGPMCVNSTTLWTCDGKDRPRIEEKCSSSYPGQPYCNKDACSSTASSPEESGGFTCTAEGYFPNPLNCSQYYICDDVLGSSFLYECPSGFAFNSENQGCRRTGLPNDCRTINCASNKNKWVGFTSDRSYYAFCLFADNQYEPMMFRCSDPENFKFDDAKKECKFECSNEGRIINPNDCSKYFSCIKGSNNRMVVSEEKCPTGFVFDEVNERCAKRSTCFDKE